MREIKFGNYPLILGKKKVSFRFFCDYCDESFSHNNKLFNSNAQD